MQMEGVTMHEPSHNDLGLGTCIYAMRSTPKADVPEPGSAGITAIDTCRYRSVGIRCSRHGPDVVAHLDTRSMADYGMHVFRSADRIVDIVGTATERAWTAWSESNVPKSRSRRAPVPASGKLGAA